MSEHFGELEITANGLPVTRQLQVGRNKRIFVNGEYREYKKQCARWIADAYSAKYGAAVDDMVITRMTVSVECYMTNLMHADIDNMLKPIMDAVVLAGLVPDDKAEFIRHSCCIAIPSPLDTTRFFLRFAYLIDELPEQEPLP